MVHPYDVSRLDDNQILARLAELRDTYDWSESADEVYFRRF